MATSYVYVDIDLDDFGSTELIDALKGRKFSPRERTDLLALLGKIEHPIDESPLATAEAEETAGRHNEALIWIERALGGFWMGRLAK
jgi:hypothetical protein